MFGLTEVVRLQSACAAAFNYSKQLSRTIQTKQLYIEPKYQHKQHKQPFIKEDRHKP